MGVASGLAIVHFLGIFVAVTGPAQSSILTGYVYTLIYRPYLEFAYLGNAYQFYSPEPGPASELWFCINYESLPDDPVIKNDKGEPVVDDEGQPMLESPASWIKIPRRENDFKDPLGQEYYRRLSLTEQMAHSSSLAEYPQAVQDELRIRRRNSNIPVDLNWPFDSQYLVPNQIAKEIILPSYIRHIAAKNVRADRGIKSIRVYRVQHWIASWEMLASGKVNSLKEPITYYPYYLGEFDAQGELKNKKDGMLYWLVPIVRNPTAKPEEYKNPFKRMNLETYQHLYTDRLMEHAGSNHMEGELDK